MKKTIFSILGSQGGPWDPTGVSPWDSGGRLKADGPQGPGPWGPGPQGPGPRGPEPQGPGPWGPGRAAPWGQK